MAKTSEKSRKLTTNEALEELLGRKAAKRIRQVAEELAADNVKNDDKKEKGKKKKASKKR